MARYSQSAILRAREAYQPWMPESLAECWLIGEEDAAEGRECSPPVGCTAEEIAAYRDGFARLIELQEDAQ